MIEGFRRRQRRRPRPRDFGNEIIIAIYPLDNNDDMKKNLTLNNHGYHHYHCSAPVPKSVWTILFSPNNIWCFILNIYSAICGPTGLKLSRITKRPQSSELRPLTPSCWLLRCHCHSHREGPVAKLRLLTRDVYAGKNKGTKYRDVGINVRILLQYCVLYDFWIIMIITHGCVCRNTQAKWLKENNN